MFTYVINTSENKTFESDLLFDLSGYNKISWMSCRLDKIGECSGTIIENQNVIGADSFRIAIIVDFFGFDKIRTPYGYQGYGDDSGIDASLYFPYIDAFITDNLIQKLAWKDIVAAAVDVYYVQNGKFESFSFLGNEKEQLVKILDGAGEGQEPEVPEVKCKKCGKKEFYDKDKYTVTFCGEDGNPLKNNNCKDRAVKVVAGDTIDPIDVSEITPVDHEAVWKKLDGRPFDFNSPVNDDYTLILSFEHKKFRDNKVYESFDLHCTPDMSLSFNIKDHPYGAYNQSLTYAEFVQGFMLRSTTRSRIKRHYYSTTYGGGAARAAFDTLSLSLYLIKMYEREESTEVEEIEVSHIDSEELKNVLEGAWSKVALAREVAVNNTQKYYALRPFMKNVAPIPEDDEEDAETAIRAEFRKLSAEENGSGLSAEELYKGVMDKAQRIHGERKDQAVFDKIMAEYLRKRDETKAKNVEESFEEKKINGEFEMTDQCPAEDILNLVVEQKQNEISSIFEHAIKAEYVAIDFDEEKRAAEKAYDEYVKAKACMGRNLFGELTFFIISMLVMLVPYQILQLGDYGFFEAKSLFLKLLTLGVFAGIMLLSFMIRVVPLVRKMNKAKSSLVSAFARCNAKIHYSYSKLNLRYEQELVDIEEANYQIAQIKRLYEENKIKEEHVKKHRETLELVQDKLSGMLNNLNIQPTLHRDEGIVTEFDITKSFRDKANKVYQIFSIETIEKMFVNKEQ